jgi:hypothetical protein
MILSLIVDHKADQAFQTQTHGSHFCPGVGCGAVLLQVIEIGTIVGAKSHITNIADGKADPEASAIRR